MPPARWRAWRAALIVGVASGVAAAAVRAQPLDGTQMPQALEGIAPAGASCPREDAAYRAPPVTAKSEPLPDLSCGLAAPELLRLRDRPDTVVVDLRLPTDHAAFRISGALRMTMSELRTKSVLKGKTVVLVGSGKAEQELYGACTALRAQGFSRVKVLRGGMPSWLSHGQAVEGRAPRLSPLTTLTAAELWGESRFDANVLLVERSQEAIQQHLPFAVPVADTEPATVKALLERRRRELKQAPLAAVILIAAASPAAMERLRLALHPVPLLVYTERPATFSLQLAQLKAAWAARERGPKQPACGQ